MQNNPPPSPEDLSSFISSTAQQETKLNDTSNLEIPNSGENRYAGEIEYVIKSQFANSLEQNRKERIKYAKYTFWLTVSWIIIVLGLVFCSGFTYKSERLLKLSDAVLITLITTTTVNVFAFFILVMQFLFNKEELAALGFLFNPKKTAEGL